MAAEFATVGARRTQIRQLAQEGNPIARKLLPIVDDPRRLDEYIATCQVGITFSSLMLGAYGEVALGPGWSRMLEPAVGDPTLSMSLSAVLVLVVLTALQIVIGELLPKSIALQFPVRLALATYLPTSLSQRLLGPFIAVLNGSGNLVLKLMRVPPSVHRHIHSLEEIDMLLTESRKGGVLQPEEESRLHRALKLSSQTARQIMTPSMHIFSVPRNLSVPECFEQMSESEYTRAIVHGESTDDLLGIVNIKDVIKALITKDKSKRRRSKDATIEPLVMPAPVIPETLSVDRLIRLLRERNSHMAIVKDEYGGTLGIVTVQDILSELMGKNIDEKTIESEAEFLSAGYVRLPGGFKLHRAQEYLGELPQHDSETLSGLIVEQLERIPDEGEIVDLPEATLKVEKVARNVVVSVLVKKRTVAPS